MKKLLLIALVALCSCETNVETRYTNDKIDGLQFRIMTVDSCEYLTKGNWFAHKGNCKYCLIRK